MRRVKVMVEVELDVVDPAALERAALAAIDAIEFAGGETERSEEHTRVATGPAAAAEWLVDPFLLAEDLTGVEATGSTSFAIDLDEADMPVRPTPDFVALFRCADAERIPAAHARGSK